MTAGGRPARRFVAVLGVGILAAQLASVSARQNPAATAGTANGATTAPTAGPWELDTDEYRIRVTTVVENLEFPMGMAWLPDGTVLVTERAGRLRIVRNGVLDPQTISGVPEVMSRGFDGLFDVTLHPKFAQNRWIYLSYSKPQAQGGAQCALARGRYDGGHELKDTRDVFVSRGVTTGKALPLAMSKLAWGHDGTIYMTCGTPNAIPGTPSSSRFQSQDPTSHRGKILRLRDDGTVPADNPLIGKSDYGLPYNPEIYAVGMRDGFGLAVHPDTGEVWEVENGPQGGDELNILKPGGNYGWPLVSLGNEYSGAPFNRFLEGTEQPFMFWGPSIAPSSIIFYTGDKFPKWKMNMFVSAMRGMRLERFVFGKNRQPIRTSSGGESEILLYELKRRIRQVRQGPDGYLYVITDYKAGALLRIAPAGAPGTTGNQTN